MAFQGLPASPIVKASTTAIGTPRCKASLPSSAISCSSCPAAAIASGLVRSTPASRSPFSIVLWYSTPNEEAAAPTPAPIIPPTGPNRLPISPPVAMPATLGGIDWAADSRATLPRPAKLLNISPKPPSNKACTSGSVPRACRSRSCWATLS